MCTRPAARRASLIAGMDLAIDSCVQGHHISKEFWTLEVGEELACQLEEGEITVLKSYTLSTKETKQAYSCKRRKVGEVQCDSWRPQ